MQFPEELKLKGAHIPPTVLPQWKRICDWLWRRHLPAVWPACWPGAHGLLSRQHHLRHNLRGLLEERPPFARRLRWLQLQRVGHPQGRPRWWDTHMQMAEKLQTYASNSYYQWHMVWWLPRKQANQPTVPHTHTHTHTVVLFYIWFRACFLTRHIGLSLLHMATCTVQVHCASANV